MSNPQQRHSKTGLLLMISYQQQLSFSVLIIDNASYVTSCTFSFSCRFDSGCFDCQVLQQERHHENASDFVYDVSSNILEVICSLSGTCISILGFQRKMPRFSR